MYLLEKMLSYNVGGGRRTQGDTPRTTSSCGPLQHASKQLKGTPSLWFPNTFSMNVSKFPRFSFYYNFVVTSVSVSFSRVESANPPVHYFFIAEGNDSNILYLF